ncbi:MAG: DNA repair protein RecN [Candidatus Hydrogenedentes bacterium]|nr:DNA repair protein RecN [Candidatus Hydrogenedentota bacterium]
MLESLYIKNFALIDEIEVNFDRGVNVLTGETGAGKSIIVEALQMALGERASAEVVRQGCESARVDAVFTLEQASDELRDLLDSQGIELEEDKLILSRLINNDGKSRAWVSGKPVSIGVLQLIGNELVDFHGQYEHQSLLNTQYQLEVLDRYIGAVEIRMSIKEKVKRLRRMEEEISSLEESRLRQTREIDLLNYELNEIQQVSPKPGEDENLRSQIEYFTNLEIIKKNSQESYDILIGSEISVLSLLNRVKNLLNEIKSQEKTLETYCLRLGDIICELEELARECRRCGELVEISEDELEKLHQRLAQINRLKRKYGSSIEEIMNYASKIKEKISIFEDIDGKLTKSKQERDKLLSEVDKEANVLSKLRKERSVSLENAILKLLKDLGMENCRFRIHITPVELSYYGIDHIQFLFSSNLGEDEKPLNYVASGGEISRVMLAIKTALADMDRIPTLVFDEIDSGIGGAMARRVGEKLKELGKFRQIILITHMPQIVALSDSHYLVTKAIKNNRTIVQVKRLSEEERTAEIARMLSGAVSEISISHAKEMLKEAEKLK